jgi:hypothetical protein
MLPELRVLAYADDETTIGRLSQAMKLVGASQPMFKEDDNLDFNMDKNKFLTKGPISARHLYERAQHFLRTDPVLQHIETKDFTLDMFTVEAIEVLGTPIGTEGYIKNFVAQKCINIIRDIEKLEPLTDVFTHFQWIQKTQNTRTQFLSANITLPPQKQFLSAQHRHVDTVIANAILKKGTRNSFHIWPKPDCEVVMASCFLGLVGSLPTIARRRKRT